MIEHSVTGHVTEIARFSHKSGGAQLPVFETISGHMSGAHAVLYE